MPWTAARRTEAAGVAWPALLLALTACAPLPAAAPASAPAGTYALELCTRRCGGDGEPVFARGTLVLDTAALAVDVEAFAALSGERDETDRGGLERRYREARERGIPNACFALQGPAHPMLSRAGPSRLAVWRPAPEGGIVVVLVQGADDAYVIRAAPAADGFAGWGAWSSAGLERGEDAVVLRRTGPPSTRACLRS